VFKHYFSDVIADNDGNFRSTFTAEEMSLEIPVTEELVDDELGRGKRQKKVNTRFVDIQSWLSH